MSFAAWISMSTFRVQEHVLVALGVHNCPICINMNDGRPTTAHFIHDLLGYRFRDRLAFHCHNRLQLAILKQLLDGVYEVPVLAVSYEDSPAALVVNDGRRQLGALGQHNWRLDPAPCWRCEWYGVWSPLPPRRRGPPRSASSRDTVVPCRLTYVLPLISSTRPTNLALDSIRSRTSDALSRGTPISSKTFSAMSGRGRGWPSYRQEEVAEYPGSQDGLALGQQLGTLFLWSEDLPRQIRQADGSGLCAAVHKAERNRGAGEEANLWIPSGFHVERLCHMQRWRRLPRIVVENRLGKSQGFVQRRPGNVRLFEVQDVSERPGHRSALEPSSCACATFCES